MTKTYKEINQMSFGEAIVAITEDPERVFFRRSRGGLFNYVAMFNTPNGIRFDGVNSISDRINYESESRLITSVDYFSTWFEVAIDQHDMDHDVLFLIVEEDEGLDTTVFTKTSVNYILNTSEKWRDIIVAIFAKDLSTGDVSLVYTREGSKQ